MSLCMLLVRLRALRDSKHTRTRIRASGAKYTQRIEKKKSKKNTE